MGTCDCAVVQERVIVPEAVAVKEQIVVPDTVAVKETVSVPVEVRIERMPGVSPRPFVAGFGILPGRTYLGRLLQL